MFKQISFAIFLSAAVASSAPSILAAPRTDAPSTESRETSSAATPSITTHLQLQNGQIAKLDRLYDAYAANRAKRETTIAQRQDQLEEAQEPSSFDERRASRLLREIGQERQKVEDDFLSTRAKSMKVLTAVQRSQLESLADDDRIQTRPDRYFQLLSLPVEELWQMPLERRIERKTARRDERLSPRQRKQRRGVASYNVYGGYSYGGPNYGVVGGYNEGPVGAHVGIGRGGPFFGVGVGGILGRRRLR